MLSKADLDYWEAALTVAALAGGGVFFLWKLYTGWLIINLKVSVHLTRAIKSADTDHLGITVQFEKGTTDSIWLKHVSARATWQGKPDSDPIDMSEELRWLQVDGDAVAWGQYKESHGSIALSPGESTSVARVTEVPANAAVTVEVAAFGRRVLWPPGFQWRASAVSLPIRGSLQRGDA